MRSCLGPTHKALLLTTCCAAALGMSAGIAQARDDDDHERCHFKDGSLIISSSAYDRTRGAVASLATTSGGEPLICIGG